MRPLQRLSTAVLATALLISCTAGSHQTGSSASDGSRTDSLESALRSTQTVSKSVLGTFASGPLDAEAPHQSSLHSMLTGLRLVCADPAARSAASRDFASSVNVDTAAWTGLEATTGGPLPVSPGHLTWVSPGFHKVPLLICSINQLRWLIWARDYQDVISVDWSHGLSHYAMALLAHLRHLEDGFESDAPEPADYDLPDSVDFYREPPDYVIQGYANYKSKLAEHRAISHAFAAGAEEVLAGDSLLEALKTLRTDALYPNKEAAALQEEFHKFFDRGGTTRTLHNLDDSTFANLDGGEYFFGINQYGQVRFGRELLREEVERIEAETGRKAPRANHAFLFPGEPLLTAGAFFVERDSVSRLVGANAGSGHYFYSNIVPTIREDIAERSDEYFLSLGHLFRALDTLGISYDSVWVSKY